MCALTKILNNTISKKNIENIYETKTVDKEVLLKPNKLTGTDTSITSLLLLELTDYVAYMLIYPILS